MGLRSPTVAFASFPCYQSMTDSPWENMSKHCDRNSLSSKTWVPSGEGGWGWGWERAGDKNSLLSRSCRIAEDDFWSRADLRVPTATRSWFLMSMIDFWPWRLISHLGMGWIRTRFLPIGCDMFRNVLSALSRRCDARRRDRHILTSWRRSAASSAAFLAVVVMAFAADRARGWLRSLFAIEGCASGGRWQVGVWLVAISLSLLQPCWSITPLNGWPSFVSGDLIFGWCHLIVFWRFIAHKLICSFLGIYHSIISLSSNTSLLSRCSSITA